MKYSYPSQIYRKLWLPSYLSIIQPTQEWTDIKQLIILILPPVV